MKVDGSLKSLLQGVSQQPARDRLPGQCTDQLNMSSDPVSGLTRRAPSDLVGLLMVSGDVRGIHEFEVANGRQFIACFTQEHVVRIYDFNGVEMSVTFSDNAANYIRQPGRLSMAAVENNVIVTNNGVIPKMNDSTKGFLNQGPNSRGGGLIQVLGGQYGRAYKVFMNGGIVAHYRPPNGSEAPMVDFTRTTHIAQRLFESMVTEGGPQAGIDGAGSYIWRYGSFKPPWGVARYEDCIWIDNTYNQQGFSLSCTDDAGNINMKATGNQVSLAADLPRFAPNRYVVRVAKETNPEDDLWLEFRTENGDLAIGGSFGNPGYWQETVSPWVKISIDSNLMPMVLEYKGGNNFHFRNGRYRDRMVGTDSNNPAPSFIGVPIQDVTTFQSRLVLLTGSYVCMSRTNRSEDFWMSTASGVVDSDPIDISSTAVQASTMYAAVPHNRDLVVFSNQGQFVIYGKNALTPQNATLTLTTAFEAELAAKPVPSGRNVFFATNYGRFTGIREFFTEGGTDINDTRPVTQHVKEFIRGKVRKMAASSNYDMLAVTTDESQNILYVYQYIWQDVEKIQSAWSRWRFEDLIEHIFFSEEVIYIVFRHRQNHQYYLVRLSLDVLDEDSIGYPVMLDQRFDVNNVYTQFELPVVHLAYSRMTFVQGPGCPNPGLTVPYTQDYTKITLAQNMNGGRIIGGINYQSMYRPTMPLIKDAGGVVQSSGKLRVKHFLCSLQNTGDINGQMFSNYGPSEPVKFQARIVGEIGNRVGKVALSNDTFVMPFRERTDRADFQLYTDSHLPMTLLDIEWQGQYTKRGRRISEGGS